MSSVPFSVVVAEQGPMVLRFCRSMLPAADAEDAWSETFLSALRAYPDLDEDAVVAAWLLTIARRKAIDIVRRRDRSAALSGAGDLTETSFPPASAAAAARSAAAGPGASYPDSGSELVDEELVEALGFLSDQQRTAVVCHHVLGLPHAQIAEILDVSSAAARRSASDGIAKLRSIYRQEQR